MLNNIPTHALVMMVFVSLLLMVGSVVTLFKKHNQPQINHQELSLRLRSWWWMVAIIFTCLYLGFTQTVILFGAISFLALKEFLSIVPFRQVDRRVIFWAYLAIPIQYYWVAIGWYGMYIIFVPVYVFLLLPIRMILLGETKGFIHSAGAVHWGVMLTVFCISHIALLASLDAVNLSAGGMGLVLYLVFSTQFNDVCQYVWGKVFGKHKIVPKISPNKTWEGFLGGLVSTVALSMLLGPYLTLMNWQFSALAGLIIAVGGFFGDLLISSVKRDLAIKDSGQLIPGHGGILDRIDSLIVAAPLFFHYYYYFFQPI